MINRPSKYTLWKCISRRWLLVPCFLAHRECVIQRSTTPLEQPCVDLLACRMFVLFVVLQIIRRNPCNLLWNPTFCQAFAWVLILIRIFQVPSWAFILLYSNNVKKGPQKHSLSLRGLLCSCLWKCCEHFVGFQKYVWYYAFSNPGIIPMLRCSAVMRKAFLMFAISRHSQEMVKFHFAVESVLRKIEKGVRECSQVRSVWA